MLLYVNSTKCDEVDHKRVRPAILEWTTGKLRRRQNSEIDNGGFGKLQMNTDDVEDVMNIKREKTAKEYLSNLDQDLELLVTAKSEIEYKMRRALMLYPSNAELKEWKDGYQKIFKISETVVLNVLKPNEKSREEEIENEQVEEQVENEVEVEEQVDQTKEVEVEEQVENEEVQVDVEISPDRVIANVVRNIGYDGVEEEEEKKEESEKEEEEKRKEKKEEEKKEGSKKEEEKKEEGETGKKEESKEDAGKKEEKKEGGHGEEEKEEEIQKEEEKKENEKEKEKEVERVEEGEETVSKSQDFVTLENTQGTNASEQTPPSSCPNFRLLSDSEETKQENKRRKIEKKKQEKQNLVLKIKTKDMKVEQGKEKVEEREKRKEKIGDKLCSPYYKRIVDSKKSLHGMERKIGEWMFSFQEDYLFVVFETSTKVDSFKFIFESMIEETEPFSNVIDTWATVLNHEERMKSKDSPSRLFMTTDVISDDIFKEDFDVNSFKEKFTQNIKDTVCEDLENIKKFDLMFFPIIKSYHFYLICYDLKKGSSHLFDNSATDVPYDAKYGRVPSIVHNLFMSVLQNLEDSRYNRVYHSLPTREKLKWRTTDNHKDCSIFVMRHMESFMGESIKTWDCGLNVKKAEQKKVFYNLRYKYLTKILMSDLNTKRQVVMDKANEYALVPKSVREEQLEKAFSTKEERFNV